MKIQKLITPFLQSKLFHTTPIYILSYRFSTNSYSYPAIKVVKPTDKGISLMNLAKNINSLPKGSIK